MFKRISSIPYLTELSEWTDESALTRRVSNTGVESHRRIFSRQDGYPLLLQEKQYIELLSTEYIYAMNTVK